eukprot:11187890-Lingulodinium_polyedra.AAC.1
MLHTLLSAPIAPLGVRSFGPSALPALALSSFPQSHGGISALTSPLLLRSPSNPSSLNSRQPRKEVDVTPISPRLSNTLAVRTGVPP